MRRRKRIAITETGFGFLPEAIRRGYGVSGAAYTPLVEAMLKIGRDVLIIALTTVALGELSLRLYNYVDPLPIFYSDSYNRFRGKPFEPDYSFHLNSEGFKDVEFAKAKTAGTIRILGIGDSFAFGVVPYEYNYLTLVEQELKQTGHNIELINMGIPNIGPREYLSLLVREGFVLDPDTVLLSFFIGNDFEIERRRSVLSYSYVASLLTYALARWSKFEGQIVHGPARYDDNEPTFTDDAYLNLELARSTIFRRNNAGFEERLEATMSYLSQIKRLCDDRKIGLTIALIPDEMQMDTPLQRRVIAASRLSAPAFDFTLPNRLLRARLEELKIDYIDLLTEFSAHAANERLYRRNDSHWNIAGNGLAARILRQHVSAHLGSFNN